MSTALLKTGGTEINRPDSEPDTAPTGNLRTYQSHLKSFTDEYHPQGATEAHLVQALADASWRLNRVAAVETDVLMDIGTPLETKSKTLANLSMHSQRLSRQFERTVTQLRELQNARRSQERIELGELLDIAEMCESQGEPYDPSEDGFVFSPAQIEAAQRARNRDRRAEEAYEYEPEAE